MVDQDLPTGDDATARARRPAGNYFVLPSEMADELRRTDSKRDEHDSHLPAKDDD
ncbi:hypothetical protein OU415_24455 [Saccharopolyspora sp. WRP15-2]|uniref:Uncharacterized protein n=1 Tax=Saccharopolyspora oryzae TaxID=2997343 RepID=A0ABT4V5M3_9PSEU|nr:hypothetical protein [Saccharopolyspora oryzae]MDA3628607.1 hypothetical protein [Saccharopolyspora oryzae]